MSATGAPDLPGAQPLTSAGKHSAPSSSLQNQAKKRRLEDGAPKTPSVQAKPVKPAVKPVTKPTQTAELAQTAQPTQTARPVHPTKLGGLEFARLVRQLSETDLKDVVISYGSRTNKFTEALINRVKRSKPKPAQPPEPEAPPKPKEVLKPAEVLRLAHSVVLSTHPQELRNTLTETSNNHAPAVKLIFGICKHIMGNLPSYSIIDLEVALFALVRCMRAILDAKLFLVNIQNTQSPQAANLMSLFDFAMAKVETCTQAAFQRVPVDGRAKIANFKDGSNSLLEELRVIKQHYNQWSRTMIACIMHGALVQFEEKDHDQSSLKIGKVFGPSVKLEQSSKEHPVAILD